MITVAVGWVDYVTGPAYQFGILYIVPVGMAGWLLGRIAGVLAAAAAATSWLLADLAWHLPTERLTSLWNGFNRLVVFGVIGQAMAMLRAHRRVELAAAERRVELSEQWLETLVWNLRDWIAVVDASGFFRYVSPGVSALGYSVEDLEGRNAFDLVHPADLTPAREALGRALTDREFNELVEVRLRRKDGVWASVEVSAQWLPPGGKFEGLVIATRDVTERNRAQANARRLGNALEQATETVIMTDRSGAIQYVNPAFERLTGYTRAEVIGQNPRLLQSGKHDAAFYHAMWATLTRGQPFHAIFVNRRKDGSLYSQETVAYPMRESNGEVTGYAGIGFDVTEKLALEARLIQAQKMDAIGRLAGGVAHDFNNLLTVILGEVDLSVAQVAAGHPVRNSLDEIRNAAHRAAGLTRQLLIFSRREVVEPVVFNLADLVGNVEKMLRRIIGEDIRFEVRLTSDLDLIEADPGQMEQVLTNLVVNARDAMPTGGLLVIEARNVTLDTAYAETHIDVAPGDYVRLAVSDTGHGMTSDVKARLFEPFFTTKEAGKGTGLGLATSYGIVKRFGGHIAVYSEVGSGTTMNLYLPRAVGTPTLRAARTGEPARGEETILLVEDDDQVRRMARKMLEPLGYTVLGARDGAEAMALLEQHREPVDLLLTDVVLPGIGGRELAERIEALQPGIRVLFSSGYTDDVILQHRLLERAVTLLRKPYTIESLAAGVREALDRPLPTGPPA